MNRTTIGLILGDPAGVGPEICAKLIAARTDREDLQIVAFGSRRSLENGMKIAGYGENRVPGVAAVADMSADARVALLATFEGPEIRPGAASAEGGAATLEAMEAAAAAANRGEIDAIVYAPLNKQAMWLAGHTAIDELHFFADRLGVDTFTCELNKQGRVWTSRVTSHIPLAEVARTISIETVGRATRLGAETFAAAQGRPPRIAVAGLNPHLGEGGAMGREEIDILGPAIDELRAEGYDIAGLYPADTVFLRVEAEGIDLVITMFHDQGQIALKALGFGATSTILGGLPLPVVTASQGTAYDIVGQNRADPSGMIGAFDLACQLATAKQLDA
ncbi:4-hydroxythreonine-4-phosphate dehydrogenase PdxA [Microbaculum marinum]|uniref:4-hydroxythreonine-4-phosphate dehydrogenase PdxA n=1 Tax=Microbaculum marinum TaxID=1764581 RepID=A0AAW9RN76_9HYPH